MVISQQFHIFSIIEFTTLIAFRTRGFFLIDPYVQLSVII